MITTHSKFLYGFDVTSDSKYIDFNDGTTTYAVSVTPGSKTPDDLCDEIEEAMNGVGALVSFTVTFNRTTRIFTIAGDAAFSLLVDTGANEADGIYTVLGISVATDFSGVTSVVGASAVGTVYQTQFKLQDFIHADNNQSQRFAEVNKAASGMTTLVTFGTDQIFEMSFKWLTDRTQHATSPIRSGTIATFTAFMQWATLKKVFEFYPDESDATDYYKVILDSSAESSGGTGYKLNPKYGMGLQGYYDTGVMKMRVVP